MEGLRAGSLSRKTTRRDPVHIICPGEANDRERPTAGLGLGKGRSAVNAGTRLPPEKKQVLKLACDTVTHPVNIL